MIFFTFAQGGEPLTYMAQNICLNESRRNVSCLNFEFFGFYVFAFKFVAFVNSQVSRSVYGMLHALLYNHISLGLHVALWEKKATLESPEVPIGKLLSLGS